MSQHLELVSSISFTVIDIELKCNITRTMVIATSAELELDQESVAFGNVKSGGIL